MFAVKHRLNLNIKKTVIRASRDLLSYLNTDVKNVIADIESDIKVTHLILRHISDYSILFYKSIYLAVACGVHL